MSAVAQPVPRLGAAMSVESLSVSYGRLQVLFDVDLEVAAGEVLALLGTNGAGKSTLLRAISGLLTPTAGQISVDGESLLELSAEQRVTRGVVQVSGGHAIFPGLTVRENLLAGMFTIRRDRGQISERMAEVLSLFPALQPLRGRRAGALSGGEQQMLALAKGLLLQPRILLIDELTLGLAPKVVGELIAVIEALRDRGTTLVLVEQSVNVALNLASRAVFMEKGEVRFSGPADALLQRDDLLRAIFLRGER
jgi:ABC-type branched-subunit amino acid transport system ATPase component